MHEIRNLSIFIICIHKVSANGICHRNLILLDNNKIPNVSLEYKSIRSLMSIRPLTESGNCVYLLIVHPWETAMMICKISEHYKKKW